MHRRIIAILGIFIVAVFLLGLREWHLQPDGRMHVNFLNVGQGDGALVTFRDGIRMLVDGGPDWSVLESLGTHLPFFDRRIDIVVLSHPNADHMTAFPEVFRRYRIATFITAGTRFDSGLYRASLSGAFAGGTRLTVMKAGDIVRIGDATVRVLWPPSVRPKGLAKDVNNDSVYLMLEEGGKRILFTGDGEESVEKTLVAAGVDLRADVLKIAHHGSKTSSGTGFLLAVDPSVAVISVGKDNTYGHPSAAVLRRLSAQGIRIRRTDVEGDVDVVW